MSVWANTLNTAIDAGAVIVLAGSGELLAERSGVLNLGLEGFVTIGAVSGVIVATETGSAPMGLIAAVGVGALAGLIFGVLVSVVKANQILCGLAAVLAGIGLANQWGTPFAGRPLAARFRPLEIPVLGDIPFVGTVLFDHDPLVIASYILVPTVLWYVLHRTRAGLAIRAVGDDPAAADSAGVRVTLIRVTTCTIAGALAGAGGVALSLSFTPGWSQGVVAGRGWVALAVVIFAMWRPLRLVFGAVLFGAMTSVSFIGQEQNWDLPAPVLNMLPFVVTLLLVAITAMTATTTRRVAAPAALALPYHREDR